MSVEQICEECGHEVSLHGLEGCEYERGDALIGGHNSHGEETDSILMAQGPCGCTAVTFEAETFDERFADERSQNQ